MRHYLWWFPVWQIISVPPIFVASWQYNAQTIAEIIWVISFAGSVLLVVATVNARENYRDRELERAFDGERNASSDPTDCS